MTRRHRLASPSLLALAWLVAAAPAGARDGDSYGMSSPQRVFAGLPRKAVVSGSIAYVALDTGVQTLDLADPASPTPIGQLYLPGSAHGLALSGTWLFVADGEAGLAVIDVQDPARPTLAATLATSGTRGVAVQGAVAYLAEASTPPSNVHGLRTVDVSDPKAPVALGFLPLPNGALDVAIAGTTAFVAIGSELASPDHGLVAIDVTDPASPAVGPAGWLDLGLPARGVALAGGMAYVVGGLPSTGLLATIDVSSPAAPVLVAEDRLCDQAEGIALAPGVAYVAAGALGLLSFDLSTPGAPRALDALAGSGTASGVATRGDLTLVAERSSIGVGGVTVIDTTAPAALSRSGSLAQAEATASAASAGVAYLLERDALHLLDVSTPGAAVPLAAWGPPGSDFSALAVSAPLAAVAEGAVVHLLDVGDPRLPAELGQVTVSDGIAVRVALSGARLFVVTGVGLESFDVSAPAAPTLLGILATAGWSSALAVDGQFGYLAAGDTLHVLDVSAAPTALGALTLPGEQLYGADGSWPRVVATGLKNRLYVVDVAAPSAPRVVGTLAGGRGFDVRLGNASALVAAGEDGLLAVDLTDPASPVLQGWLDTSGRAVGVARRDDDVYVSTLEGQQWMLRCSVCASNCAENWPVVAANSLRAVRSAGAQMLSWSVAGSSGSSNLHRTLAKGALAVIASDPASIAATVAGLGFLDAYDPAAGTTAFYRVFGRGSCTGASHEP